MKIVTVLGTRPEIIKLSPLLPRLDELGQHVIVHSGQHYSAEMDAVFFDDLELRTPDRFLRVGSRPPVEQVARIATGVEDVIRALRPDWVIVHGDTNTTLAGALAAAKYRAAGVRLAHVEAGARSFNELQPEELNRVLVDRMSDLLFAPTDEDAANLAAEGIREDRVVVTGNTVVEACTRMASLVNGDAPFGLSSHGYVVATLHRPETVDMPDVLPKLWRALVDVAGLLPVVVLLHPRTRRMLAEFGVKTRAPGLDVREPVGYREMIALLKGARFCITDSGGLQEEAAILGVPALVPRNETEHRRYVNCGLHRLAGPDPDALIREARLLLTDAICEERRRMAVKPDNDVTETIIRAIR
ncbi:MAG: non-hydrolyzing UDP-N-acetylglucosamine 2-epimerase [Spirochaetota bacterium]